MPITSGPETWSEGPLGGGWFILWGRTQPPKFYDGAGDTFLPQKKRSSDDQKKRDVEILALMMLVD